MGTFNKMSRRSFIKGIGAAGLLAGLGGASGLAATLQGKNQVLAMSDAKHVYGSCPRNCYDTCALISTVEDGVVKFVTGNPNNTYTNGRLCVKGYTYPRTIYSPDRIKYPMRQNGKGTGNWERISWDEAFNTIARKILDIKAKYGDTLPVCLDKYSGNFNVLSYGVEGMMTSIGHTTRAQGTPCWPAGIDSQNFDFGAIVNSDPETFIRSQYLIVWGANPAWCSVHSMNIIQKAKEQGCKVIVIDPILTDTASKADCYIEIKTGTDGALALGMAKYIIDNGLHDEAWMAAHSLGYQDYLSYVQNNITLAWASEKTGVPVQVIEKLAQEYATTKPSNIWIGYGMQRHTNGGAAVRAIDALAALTGSIGTLGGGANYAQLESWGFTYYAMTHCDYPEATPEGEDRMLNINNFGAEVLALNQEGSLPVKLLWVACRNPISQSAETSVMKKAYESIDLVVATDLFMNPTVEMADIVLPVTTIFETWGLHASYWHYWMNVNEPAIEPMYEAKCDVEIAMGLSRALNALQPGSCTFRTDLTMEDWVSREMSDAFVQAFGFASWRDILRKGTVKVEGYDVAWQDGVFRTPSSKYEFLSANAAKFDNHPLPAYREGKAVPAAYPVRLLSPHWKLGLHSQFQNLDWMQSVHNEPFAEIHPELAATLGIGNGDWVKVHNDIGFIKVKAKYTKTVPKDAVAVYEAWYKDTDFNVNYLVKVTPADMGRFVTGQPGIAFHDTFVSVEKA